jgi:hypothetical protein
MLDSTLRYLSILLIVTSPFLYAMETLFSQVIYAYGFFFVFLFFVFSRPKSFYNYILMFKKIYFYIFVFLVYAIISVFFRNEFVSIDGYIHGTFLFCLYVLAFSVFIFVFKDSKYVDFFILSSISACFLVCAYSVVNYYSSGYYELFPINYPWDFKWEDQLRGFFSYKNHFATYLSFNIILTLFLITKSVSLIARFLYVSLFFVFALSFIFVGSRGAFIALLFVLIYTNYKLLWNYRTVAFGVFISCFSIFFIGTSIVLFERFVDLGFNTNGRFHLYMSGLKLLSGFESIFLGYGIGSFPHVIGMVKSEFLNGNAVWHHFHNDFLEILQNVGVIGCFLIYLIFKQIHMYSKLQLENYFYKPFFYIIIFYFLHSSIDFIYASPVLSFYFVLSIAILLSGKQNIN